MSDPVMKSPDVIYKEVNKRYATMYTWNTEKNDYDYTPDPANQDADVKLHPIRVIEMGVNSLIDNYTGNLEGIDKYNELAGQLLEKSNKEISESYLTVLQCIAIQKRLPETYAADYFDNLVAQINNSNQCALEFVESCFFNPEVVKTPEEIKLFGNALKTRQGAPCY